MAMTTNNFKKFIAENKTAVLIAVIALIWAFFSVLTYNPDIGWPTFLTARNFSNLLRQMAITGMLASAMVFVIVSGEIDLSVGSLLAFLGGVAAILDVQYHWPLTATVPVVMLLGIAAGMLTGWLTAYLAIPSFIVTLGGMLVFRGMTVGSMHSQTIAPTSKAMEVIGQGYLPETVGYAGAALLFALLVALALRTRASKLKHSLPAAPLGQEMLRLAGVGVIIAAFILVLNSYQGVPVPVLTLLIIFGVFTITGNKTTFGRHIYAVGSNMEATRFSGVNVALVKMMVFALMGLMCAFAGLTTTARLAAASPSAGVGAELDAISACFIGGTSMRGGIGTVGGALVGAMIMASLDNGMSALQTEPYIQLIIKGVILVGAVYVDIVLSGARRT